MCISPSILPSIQQLCPPPSKAIKTVISLFHRQAFHISFRERPESSPYLHGYYTVCMRVKTMGSAWWDHGTSFLRGHSGRHKDNPGSGEEDGDGEGRRISRSLSPGLRGRSSPSNKKEKKKRRRRRGRRCNGGGGSRGLSGDIWGPETKVGDWNSNSSPLFLPVYGNPRRTERCCCWLAAACCCRMSAGLLVWQVWSASCRDGERSRECSTEEDMAEWSDRPGEGGGGWSCRKRQLTSD